MFGPLTPQYGRNDDANLRDSGGRFVPSGNDSYISTASTADFYVDIEDAFQALGQSAPSMVGYQYTVITREIGARLGTIATHSLRPPRPDVALV
jgi:hypothetical protein